MGKGLPHNEFIAQLRGVAILAVVVMHYAGHINYFSLHFIENGYYGVALFFAISGFLITANILQRYETVASVSFRDFYVMRAARILPPLALRVAILLYFSLATELPYFAFPAGLSAGGAVWHIVTLRFNLYYLKGAQAILPWAVLWSISIEETFYLAYPLVAFLLRRERLLICLLLSVIAYGPLARPNVNGLLSYFGCFDLMDMGALAAIAARRLHGKTLITTLPYIKTAGAMLALSTYLLLNVRDHFMIGPSLVALGGSLMLFSSQVRGRGEARRTLLGSIGETSYEIYLFHGVIFVLLMWAMPEASGVLSYVAMAVSMIVVYAACMLIARCFSKPINSAIRLYFSASPKVLSPVQSASARSPAPLHNSPAPSPAIETAR